MALFNTINFLPPAFRSKTNQRFLGATLDQLVTDANNLPVNGYIGRKFAPTYKSKDNYVSETGANRQNYQLEASVVVKDADKNIEFNANYIDLLNSIKVNNGLTNNHQRLFASEKYNYDGHFDYDKFVNYYNYYWLPNGPDAVTVSANNVPYRADYTVTRNTDIAGYVFGGVGVHPNLPLTLARGGNYTFKIDQPGFKFWIQTEPGVSGVDANVGTITTRQVFGVDNNGTDNGLIRFIVPRADAQDFYTLMPIQASVDAAAATFSYSQIQNRLLSEFLTEFPEGIDSINNQLNNKTIIFINNNIDDSFWTAGGVGGYLPGIAPVQYRQGTWRIGLIPTNDNTGDYTIQLTPDVQIASKQKVFVQSGKTYASQQFWLDNNKRYQSVPNITSTKDYLYYQDSANPEFVGTIKLVDNTTSSIDVANDIIGKKAYTSPTGVKFTNGLKIVFDTTVTPSTYANNEYYVEGVGTNIQLVPVAQLVAPEPFGVNIGTTADYITINRASQDLNSWSRSNRWFHKDVITATATYNNSTANYGPDIAGRRPIIEFEANLQLMEYGVQAGRNINYIVLEPSDAFVEIEGKAEYKLDGVYKLTTGDRIVFTQDHDTNIVNEVYRVEIQRINASNYINLVLTDDDPVEPGQNFLVTNGTHKGRTFTFNGTGWTAVELNYKTLVNQPPLFDLVDSNGYSFSDTTVYPGSTFAGTKFFGYKIGTGKNDTLLGFPLSYQNFNNIGDIVFSNFYDTDTFTYSGQTENCNTGYLVRNDGLTSQTKLNNWTDSLVPTEQFQVFTAFYKGLVLTINGVEQAFVPIDALPTAQATVPRIKVYLNNRLLVNTVDYKVTKYGVYDIVTLTVLPNLDDKIDVEIFSNTVSKTGYYEIPDNLDLNPLNENFNLITLGQLRTHYNKLIENTTISPTGQIPVQDRYLKQQGGTLIQHSSPLIYATTFLNDPTVNFANGLNLAKKEYQKFKNKFLGLCASMTSLDYTNTSAGVDSILQNINALKNNNFSWYYSDMVPQGESYSIINYTVLNVRQMQYEIGSIFDVTQLSNRAVLVYVNGVQQMYGTDYVFNPVSPAITFLRTFAIGDKIVIKDYASTDGNYIPETPTKLGLYPKFTPAIYLDTTYQTPTMVIRGHDGSVTPAFGDFRDDYLLELELRIYNNIKADYKRNQIDLFDVIPGRFRTTEYSLSEYNQVMAQNFLSWVGNNNVDYASNTGFDPDVPFSWNYGKTPDVVDGSYLQGYWRAIYNYWYDTDTPNITPWVMLGLSEKPAWWDSRYGAAPYTSGNLLLWGDLEAGYNYNNGNPYTDSRFVRPGLTKFIPVDRAGNLIDPAQIPVIRERNVNTCGDKFQVGQHSPAETAWRRSSDYPFAVQSTLALLKPAEYFATQLDTSRFYANPVTGQFSNLNNQKITPGILTVNGKTSTGIVNRTSGYINWIADGIKNLGIDPVAKILEYFTNFSVQLNYKVAGFTDSRMLTVTAEQTTPGSTSASVIIPDTNYKVYLHKSVPSATAVYSAVIVEKTAAGYSVSGYDTSHPYFTIIPSLADNTAVPVDINGVTIQLYQKNTGTTQSIAYGTEFATVQQVSDFLYSYQRYLVGQGFVFNQFNTDLSVEQNWTLSIKELVYWSQQGWANGTIIVLNPTTNQIILSRPGYVVDEITNTGNGNKLLDQNFVPIKNTEFNILRQDLPGGNNSCTINTLNGSSVAYAKLNLIQYEHVLIFDNVDDFGDIIYIPSLGTRQYRLKLSGQKTGAWDGALSATGYVYNDPMVQKWQAEKDYRLGDIVQYNNFYYTASQDIPASAKFNTILWTRIQKSAIQTGLLPGFALNAQEFTNFYDVDNPPANEMFQEYSAGLIGFRQREYLTQLGISVPTQTKFYQGFIKEKGSHNSINALTKANFNNVSGDIGIYEEWAFRVGTYGGVNSNQFKEFLLDQAVFKTNPVAFVSTNSYNTGNIIVQLNGNSASTNSNVYNASNLVSTVTSIYSDRTDEIYINDLPTAGYVNVADVDYTQYDIAHPTLDVTNIGTGKKVWVAKDYTGNWNVYRINETNLAAISLSFSLDSYAHLKFDRAHSFNTGDVLILKHFDDTFDGLYSVISAPTPTTVTIEISNKVPASANAISPLQKLIRALTITGSGTVYKFASAKFNTINAVASTAVPTNGWLNGDRVWINRATTAGWGVYTYHQPWLANAKTQLTSHVSTAQFGSAVKLNNNRTFVYSGSPVTQQVFANAVAGGTSLIIANVETKFGSTIDSQGNIVVVGSTANVHVYSHNATIATVQTIVGANVAHITSIALSSDCHWLYVGDGIANIVEAYYTANTAVPNYHWANKIAGTGSFGNVVKTNSDGSQLFVGAPTADVTAVANGKVLVYSRSGNTFSASQTLTSQHQNQNAAFGTSITLDSTAGNLYIGAPGSTASGQTNGLVERYVESGGTYIHNANIAHPSNEVGAFGVSIGVSPTSQVLAVGSAGSPGQETTTFDNATLTIDTATTKFIDHIVNTGAVYLFEPLINQSVAGDLGEYVYIQELEIQAHSGDRIGAAVDVTESVIAVGAPGASASYVFANPTQSRAWNLTRQQQPTVDIDSVSRTFIYNKLDNSVLATLDYFDPAKGKVLNVVDRDIDFKLARDPALYNAGMGVSITDLFWGPDQVGTIWWNLDTVRYVNYEQDALIYRLNHWGKQFPDSSIDVYQWVESTVPPSQYTGTGMPLHRDDSAYSTYGYVNPATGAVTVRYYFWVAQLTTIAAGKHNSVYSVAESIRNPASQGVPYATVLRNDAVALYNINNILTAQNSVIQLGSQIVRTNNDPNLMHSEYALVQEGNPSSQVPNSIQTKFIDSLAGVDAYGNQVPESLIPSQRYGIGIRPRQTMIIDQPLALSNYLDLVNPLLQAYPIVERKVLTTLNSEELAPNINSGEYVLTVASFAELGYVNTALLTVGDRVLVVNDETNLTKWTIYELGDSGFNATPVRVQSYKTNLYWTYSDWYASSYNPTSMPDLTVANNLDLGKLTLTANTYIKVLEAGKGNFAVYYVDHNLNKNLVGIENGTVQINTTSIPALELRQILVAMQTEIFVDDIANEYNNIFFAMIKYILTEQKNLDWVFKTSFIAATQAIRKLAQFVNYIPDNQNYYLNYLEEVKPYRTKIREFVIDYIGNDTYNSDITDFDLPPYWEANLSVYRSPSGEQVYDNTLIQQGVNSQWYSNYKYQVVDFVIERAGTGYLFPPQIVIDPPFFANGIVDSASTAEAYSEIDAYGHITSVYVTNPGKGYITKPNVRVNGTGFGANASAVMRNVYSGNNQGHNVVRSIGTTIKFDRVNYNNTYDPVTNANSHAVVLWNTITANVNIGQTVASGTVINLENQLYLLANDYVITGDMVLGTVNFPFANVTAISAGDLYGANDRVAAFNGNVNFKLLADGIDYPGVVVDGNTYVGTEIDSVITSAYTDALGINPSTINIDGGAYVDTFSSHAPQELVPGRMFDSVDMTVFDTNQLAYRTFINMSGDVAYTRIAQANTTVLSANLHLTDTVISVADASLLPKPNPKLGIPGVVFINGEKIIYYRNYSHETVTPWAANTSIAVDTLMSYSGNTYLTTGNVYASYFANITSNVSSTNINTLAQIHRSVDGTSPQQVHLRDVSRVVDASVQQAVPGSVTKEIVISNDTTYKSTNDATLKLTLTGIIRANIGDIIEQRPAGSTVASATLRALETVSNSSVIAALPIAGGVAGLVDSFDSGIGLNAQGADTERIASPTAPTRRLGDLLPTWTANTIQPVDTAIYYLGNVYVVQANVYGATFGNISSNVTYSDRLTTEFHGNTTVEDLTLQVGDQWWNTTSNVLYQWNGSTYVVYNPTNPGIGFDSTSSEIYVNGVKQGCYIKNFLPLGMVNLDGEAVVGAGTALKTDNWWYNSVTGPATQFDASTTEQVSFLKDGKSWAADSGNSQH